MGFNNYLKLQIHLGLVLSLGLLYLRFSTQCVDSLSPSTSLKSFWQCKYYIPFPCSLKITTQVYLLCRHNLDEKTTISFDTFSKVFGGKGPQVWFCNCFVLFSLSDISIFRSLPRTGSGPVTTCHLVDQVLMRLSATTCFVKSLAKRVSISATSYLLPQSPTQTAEFSPSICMLRV